MSNVILCHQIYSALPKYATGIKDLPHPLNVCVCGHLLLSTSDLLTVDQTKPTYQTNWCHSEGSERD